MQKQLYGVINDLIPQLPVWQTKLIEYFRGLQAKIDDEITLNDEEVQMVEFLEKMWVR